MKKINFWETDVGLKDFVYQRKIFKENFPNEGNYVIKLQNQIKKILNVKYCIALPSCTSALYLAVKILDLKKNQEILIPNITFAASANAAFMAGVKIKFVDVNPETLNIDMSDLRRKINKNTKAIMPVHVSGRACDMRSVMKIAKKKKLHVIEDAAEALGSWRDNTHCGLFGSIGTLSFNGNKLITTGGGGALLTNDAELAHRARHLSTTAKRPHPWAFEHDAVGWNDRLPNINAALGVAQLEDLDRRLEAKRQISQRYVQAFAGLRGVELLEEPVGCRSNFWMVSLRFTASDPLTAQAQRLKLLEAAHEIGILIRPIWTPLHKLPMYFDCPSGLLPVAENQAARIVNLPSSPQLMVGWSAT